MSDHSEILIPLTLIIIVTVGFGGGLGILMTYPRSVTGEVTAVQESYFAGTLTTVYMKTLNGADSGLSISFFGTTNNIKLGSVYKISTGWVNSLISIEKIF